MIELKSGKTSILDTFCVFVCGWGLGYGPCPPIRNDIVTLLHLLSLHKCTFAEMVTQVNTPFWAAAQIYNIVSGFVLIGRFPSPSSNRLLLN